MRHASLDWSTIETSARRFGVPLAIALIAYALSPLLMVASFHIDSVTPQRVTAVSRWEESLPGIGMHTDDFARMLERAAPPTDAKWQPATLPVTLGHAAVVWAPNEAELRRVWYRFEYSRRRKCVLLNRSNCIARAGSKDHGKSGQTANRSQTA
jgi:hypothetical protein